MSGLAEYNFPEFNARAAHLRSLGHEVFNPAELEWITGDDYDQILRDVIKCLEEFAPDELYLLPGWEDSIGTLAEMHYAQSNGIPIVPQDLISEEILATL